MGAFDTFLNCGIIVVIGCDNMFNKVIGYIWYALASLFLFAEIFNAFAYEFGLILVVVLPLFVTFLSLFSSVQIAI